MLFKASNVLHLRLEQKKRANHRPKFYALSNIINEWLTMSKLNENNIPTKTTEQTSSDGYFLDTLAQLDTNLCNVNEHNKLDEKVRYQKRAKSKAITNGLVFALIDANETSKLNKSYWNTYHCNNVLLQQGNKISTTYCNNRWCMVCNRVRTAKLINAYAPTLNEFQNPMFVTLTDKTVCGRNLASALSNRTKCLSNVIRTLKKRLKSNIKAIRKVEVTYNEQTNEYHPHIHILVDGDLIATEIVKEWLKRNRTASNDAQDITQANQDSLIELFKYTTKLVTKNGINPQAQDLIFNVLRRKRTIQTYGIKRQCDKIDEYDTTEITFKRPQIEIFKFDKYDWVSAYGEVFSEYEPSNDTIELINKLHLQNR